MVYIEMRVIMISMNFAGEYHSFPIDFTCSIDYPFTGVVSAEEVPLPSGESATPCLDGVRFEFTFYMI
jgi:hypothetical protein